VHRKTILCLCFFWATGPLGHWATLLAQASRHWRPEERSLLSDLSYVTAVAATRRYVYSATPDGLAVYDRGLAAWVETIGALDGFPQGIVTAMAADPDDDRAWLAFGSRWAMWDPFARRLEGGPLPGNVDQVVLDAHDPSRGAWFHTLAGWYIVERGSLTAFPAPGPPATRLGGLSARELMARIPAFDAVRMRVERDEQLRTYRLTSATVAPLTNELYVGTDGNGTFRVDPVTYTTDRFPAGLLGSATGAVAAWRGTICAAGEARVSSPHHGIACFDESLGNFNYFERMGLATLPVGTVRRLLVTERAVWAATDQGLLRAPRRGGRPIQLLVRDGLPSDQVLSLAPSATGVYVGTAGGIASVADTGRTPVVEASARGPAVLALAIPGNDTVWAGTTAGVVGFLLPLGGPVAVPIGPSPLREPIVAIAVVGDTIVASTAQRFVIRSSSGWQVMETPGRPIGRIAAIVPGETGFWVAGDQGVAYFDPQRPVWNALATTDDVPLPVRDVAESHGYVWVATDAGVVRYAKRLLTQ
jgi:ligand-binding sensor domain-containing protein